VEFFVHSKEYMLLHDYAHVSRYDSKITAYFINLYRASDIEIIDADQYLLKLFENIARVRHSLNHSIFIAEH